MISHDRRLADRAAALIRVGIAVLIVATATDGHVAAEGTFFKSGRPQATQPAQPATTGVQPPVASTQAPPPATTPPPPAPLPAPSNVGAGASTPNTPSTAMNQQSSSATRAPMGVADSGNVAGSVGQVISTDTLVVAGRTVQLAGIRGTNGPLVDGFRRWLATQGNQLSCTAAGPRYTCATPNGRDIGPIILAVGAGQATEDAPPSYASFEAQARAAHRGVWAAQR